MDNANEELSKQLQEVLDLIGASEFIRTKYRESAMLMEIPMTFESQLYGKTFDKTSSYQVGSSFEGTTTLGLDSDVDKLACNEGSPVVENLIQAKQHGLSYLIVTDDTKPGYVRLQCVKDKSLLSVGNSDVSEFNMFKVDSKCRICLAHPAVSNDFHTFRNGPAYTIPALNGFYQLDLVFALRCRNIPISANTWLRRIRKNNWPTHKQLRTMASYGCFFVGVGQYHSDDKSIEWRISFSLQERDLMSSLNETQHKCYILLKMIKNDIIEPNAGESISSYHCKTCLFYTIEKSQRHIWKDGNLILCARLCLIRVLKWVKAKHCPNYFIPEDNMFDKLSTVTFKLIECVLKDIIESGVNFLFTLSCDNLGELLKSKICVSEVTCSLAETSTIGQPRLKACESIQSMIYNVRNRFLSNLNLSYTCTDYMNETIRVLYYLQHTNHVTEHTTRDVRMALDYLIPHIQLQYEQCLFAQYVSLGDLSRLLSKKNPDVIPGTSSDVDLFSSKLSLASLYIQSKQLDEECKRILVSCEKSLEPYVMSVCGCNDHELCSNPALTEKLLSTDMSSKYFSRQCTTGCMVFHPTQVCLVHAALHYEMFRKVYTKSSSALEASEECWLAWITVDSQIYLYFLQYLLYSKNNKHSEKETAVQKLMHVLNTDSNLGHKETSLNLLAWIQLQDNDLRTSWRLLCRSWKIRPFKNAAKWHMLVILSEVIQGK